MKLIIIMLVFMLFVVSNALAIGLDITEIDFHVDYDEAYTFRIEPRDRINSGSVPVANNSRIDADIFPGSNVTFTIRVENTLQDEKTDIKGIVVLMRIEEIDDGADLDEESIDFDLEPGEDERVDVKFSIPLDADAGSYNIVMEAEGEGANQTTFRTELRLKLEVKKRSHDVRIVKASLNPTIVDCNRKSKIQAEIMNLGSNAESELALEFRNANLGINSYDSNILLESSAEASEDEKKYTKTLAFDVPSFFRAGTYPILVNLYWKNFILFDKKGIDLIVKDCDAKSIIKQEQKKSEEIENKTEVVTIIPESGQLQTIEKNGLITTSQEISVLNSEALILVFSGAFAIAILIVLIVFTYVTTAKTK